MLNPSTSKMCQPNIGIVTMVQQYLLDGPPAKAEFQGYLQPTANNRHETPPPDEPIVRQRQKCHHESPPPDEPTIKQRRVSERNGSSGRPRHDNPSPQAINTRNCRDRQQKESSRRTSLDDDALQHGTALVQLACEHNFEVPGDYLQALNMFIHRFESPIRVRIVVVDFLVEKPKRGPKPATPPSIEERRRLAQSQPGMVHEFLKLCLKVVKDVDTDQYDSFMEAIATSAPTLHDSLVINFISVH